jgi:hypothetical protein
MKVTKGIFALLMLPFEMESDCVLIVTYVTTVEGKKILCGTASSPLYCFTQWHYFFLLKFQL